MRGGSTPISACRAALAAFLESRFGVKHAQRALRSAGVGVRADRARRARAIPPGAVRAPRHPRQHRRLHRLSHELDRGRGLRRRHRGGACGSKSGSADGKRAAAARRFPELVILVTGDGARRAEFERRFAGLPARRIQLRARLLEPDDYPRVVGSADLGLCLHRSSSGLDIPMKIADLFGAGVPVCALDYGACLAERVRHGDNGLLFSNGAPARRRAVRSVRSVPGRSEARSIACGPARASRPARRGKKGGRARPGRSASELAASVARAYRRLVEPVVAPSNGASATIDERTT